MNSIASCTSSFWFYIRVRLLNVEDAGRCQDKSMYSYLDSIQQPQRPTTSNVCKTRDCWCSFELLVMGGLSPETCWALYKYGIINFDTLLHLVGYFCMNLKIQCIWNSDLYHYVLFRYWNNSEPVCFKDGAVLHGSSTIQYGNASLPCGSHCYGWLIQGTETYYNSQCHCSKLK